MEIIFQFDLSGLDIRITQPIDANAGTWAIRGITELQAQEIDEFITKNELGHRTAYDRWRFNNRKCLTVFMLKYG
jgi:hypothetical protein